MKRLLNEARYKKDDGFGLGFDSNLLEVNKGPLMDMGDIVNSATSADGNCSNRLRSFLNDMAPLESACLIDIPIKGVDSGLGQDAVVSTCVKKKSTWTRLRDVKVLHGKQGSLHGKNGVIRKRSNDEEKAAEFCKKTKNVRVDAEIKNNLAVIGILQSLQSS
ncbi:hypothetical protein PTKIN_Ptkin04bG0041400 [Pterospermum kingtungense]